MRQSTKFTAAAALVVAAPALAAVPIIDGTLDAIYGPALAVQQVQTQFGDATSPGSNGGSELNAAYAVIIGERLYVMLTGNLERNFNKLSVFFDSKPGGENVLSANPRYDFETGFGWNSTFMGGMRFDDGFEADYHLFARSGSNFPAGVDVDFVDRQGGVNNQVPGAAGFGSGFFAGFLSTGTIAAGALGPNASSSSLTSPLDFALDNSNVAGVTGGTGPADQQAALAVTTGFEFSIALADLGYTGGPIRISAMINNSDHNYLSNQFLGALPPDTGNLGGNGTGVFTGNLAGIDLNNFPGLQYFVVLPSTPEFILGDFNFDGGLDGSDVDPFVLALSDLDTYLADFADAFADAYPGLTLDSSVVDIIGDFNGDSGFDGSDVDGFVAALSGGRPGIAAIPEPAALGLLAPAALLLSRRRR